MTPPGGRVYKFTAAPKPGAKRALRGNAGGGEAAAGCDRRSPGPVEVSKSVSKPPGGSCCPSAAPASLTRSAVRQGRSRKAASDLLLLLNASSGSLLSQIHHNTLREAGLQVILLL
ncbi:unnamed protein product [Caretta caretta]